MHFQTQQNAKAIATLLVCGGRFCRWAKRIANDSLVKSQTNHSIGQIISGIKSDRHHFLQKEGVNKIELGIKSTQHAQGGHHGRRARIFWGIKQCHIFQPPNQMSPDFFHQPTLQFLCINVVGQIDSSSCSEYVH